MDHWPFAAPHCVRDPTGKEEVMERLFMSREKRDEAWREGGRRGRRGTVMHQQIHPMYVEDFEGPEKEQTGFGNTVYKTYFAKLYTLEV